MLSIFIGDVITVVSPFTVVLAEVPLTVTPDIDPCGIVVPLGNTIVIVPTFATKAPFNPVLKLIVNCAASEATEGSGVTAAELTFGLDGEIV